MNEQLKAFQQVLVRDSERGTWMCDLYSHYDIELDIHFCVGGRYEYCIPYEGNEHLLGTTDEPKPKRWRAKYGENYYIILITGRTQHQSETGSLTDDKLFEIGNYFRTREEAEAMAEKFKTMLKGGQDEND